MAYLEAFPEATTTQLAMATAVQFIENHLHADIKVADMATAVHYSLFHFCRIFNQVTHHPPYDYLVRRRLTEAAHWLADGARVTEVALDCQFGSPEAFSRAFKRLFGLLPSQWQKSGWIDPRCFMTPLTPAHLAHRSNAASVRPQVVERPSRMLAGLMTVVDEEATAVPHLWQTLRECLDGALAQQPAWAVRHYVPHYPNVGVYYLAGVETAANIAFPPVLVNKTMPSGLYACFALPASVAARQLLNDYIYQTWLPQSRYQLSYPLEVLAFTGWTVEPVSATLEIPIMPV
jgi:AraC family transcriptional regulator